MPTSLTYIVLSTRGCSPWRPAAVMSTTSFEDDQGRSQGVSLGFSRAVKGAPDRLKASLLFQSTDPCASSSDFRVPALLRRKENSSQDTCQRLQVLLRCRSHPKVWFRNLNRIPFRGAAQRIGRFHTDLPYLLGSTHPWPTAVPMEPFPTSVFKVLI